MPGKIRSRRRTTTAFFSQCGSLTPTATRREAAFDALGLVVGTAILGKAGELGDSLQGFEPDLTGAQIDAFFNAADPHTLAPGLLKNATTRIIYDVDRFRASAQANPNDPAKWQPAFAATLARETHVADLGSVQPLRIQLGFSYSDGFGREIQKIIQAEPGPVEGTGENVNPRWVSSGWTIFNNKGKPVRQYEPFFTATHRFVFGNKVGVSPVLFYDPVERVIATLHPNHTYDKVVFDPWLQTTWDVNDTVLLDPRTDPDIQGFVSEYFKSEPGTWKTWHALRIDGTFGATAAQKTAEQQAAQKTAVHAATPARALFDVLGRSVLTIAHNRFQRTGEATVSEEFHSTRVKFDIEGNQREVEDALGRVVMRYDYDMLGNRIHQASMEAGRRWTLGDVTGKPIRAWDSRGHALRTEYDALRRPIRTLLQEGPAAAIVVQETLYGEDAPVLDPRVDNLRGKVLKVFDAAGIVTSDKYDVKGNPLRATSSVPGRLQAAGGLGNTVSLEDGG